MASCESKKCKSEKNISLTKNYLLHKKNQNSIKI